MEKRQNTEFSLEISVSFPLLSVQRNKGPPYLFRQLVQGPVPKNAALWEYMVKVTTMGMA